MFPPVAGNPFTDTPVTPEIVKLKESCERMKRNRKRYTKVRSQLGTAHELIQRAIENLREIVECETLTKALEKVLDDLVDIQIDLDTEYPALR
jgi:hypothetical protein